MRHIHRSCPLKYIFKKSPLCFYSFLSVTSVDNLEKKITVPNEARKNCLLLSHNNTNFTDVLSPNCIADVPKTQQNVSSPKKSRKPEKSNMHKLHKPRMAFMCTIS